MKRWLLTAAIATAALLAGLAAHLLPTRSTGDYMVLKLKLADADGRPQPMEQWSGKILVINYWATWCPPCIEEMPAFSRLHTQFSGKGVQFVGIGVDNPDKISHFRDSRQISYPLLVGGLDAIGSSIELGNRSQALPFTAIFDARRTLVATKLGLWPEAELQRELEGLVAR